MVCACVCVCAFQAGRWRGGGWSIGDRRCSRGPGCFVPRQHPVDPPHSTFLLRNGPYSFLGLSLRGCQKNRLNSVWIFFFFFASKQCCGILKFVNSSGGRGFFLGSLWHRRSRYSRIMWSANDHALIILQSIRSDWFSTVKSAHYVVRHVPPSVNSCV